VNRPGSHLSKGVNGTNIRGVGPPPLLVQPPVRSPVGSPGTPPLRGQSIAQKLPLVSEDYPAIPNVVPPFQQILMHQNQVEAGITRIFENKPSEVWTIFSNSVVSNFNATSIQMEKLRHIFDTKNGAVEKNTWLTFLQWFTPLLCPDNTYMNNGQPGKPSMNGGYDMETILEICAPSWFHGFLDSKEAQRILKTKSEGTFLLRFSTGSPGSYTLSVAYSGTVGHWRIACEKKPSHSPTFKIDTRVYKSLGDIVNTHRSGKEPLRIRQPKPGTSDTCFLISSYDRPEAAEAYYQVV